MKSVVILGAFFNILINGKSTAQEIQTGQGLRKKSDSRRRLQEEPCILMLKKVLMKDMSEIEEVDCYDPTSEQFMRVKGPEGKGIEAELLDQFHSGKIHSAQSTFIQKESYIDDEEGTLNIDMLDNAVYGEEDPSRRRKRKLVATTGTREMLAVRIIAADASTTASEYDVSDNWFGTYGDPLNLKSQYEACSYDKLKIKPADVGSGWAGVYTARIEELANGASDSVIRNAAVAAVRSDLGNLESQFDHVMLCIPPGTSGRWVGYAYLGGWLSVFNDEWCGFPSIQMHEIGHNLLLGHSGERSSYDDMTGVMGYSFNSDDSPYMCFNAAKNSQLGWYADREKEIHSGWTGNIYGIADYGITNPGDTVIAKIAGESEEWYFSFNRKTGINRDTHEGGDRVLVHKRPFGDASSSYLMAKLKAGQTFLESPLAIQVNSIDLASSPGFASVTFFPYIPTSPPTPFLVPQSNCADGSGKFTLPNGKLRKCNWLYKKAKITKRRKNKFCGRDNLIPLCPETCGYCNCDDNTNFRIPMSNGSYRKCDWLNSGSDPSTIADKKATYCSSDFKNGKVRYNCAASCETCSTSSATNAAALSQSHRTSNIFSGP